MKEIKDPGKISSYFKSEWKSLLLVTISGLIYNIGLLSGPLFEGQLAQCLMDILNHKKIFSDMLRLAIWYIVILSIVQTARYVKRLYVRRFANNINRHMKRILYGNLVYKSKAELDREQTGSVMTRAISDVDACAEGMRKFTTELFDTGVALLGYIGLLLYYDWKLALLCLIFPPFSYLLAEKMKVIVQRTGASLKESAGRLSEAALDRAGNALSYRVFGCEEQRNADYEDHLCDYEKAAVRANILTLALPPLYHVISMVSVLFILYFGFSNVRNGVWNMAAFTAFLTCFTRLSVKSSKAAKLFNSVQKAEVSWKRIHPLLKPIPKEETAPVSPCHTLTAEDLTVAPVFEHLSFTAKKGQIIGITGSVACGKSTLGRCFLAEQPYEGSILFNGKELSSISSHERCSITGYLGHDVELLSDSIKNNILLGSDGNLPALLDAVCLSDEVHEMPHRYDTLIGTGGVLLSGGQQQRVALARTFAHKKPLLILDDPFSALDKKTERMVFEHLKEFAKDAIVLLISHRLYLFPELDQVIFMENGTVSVSDHMTLMKENPLYRELYTIQNREVEKSL